MMHRAAYRIVRDLYAALDRGQITLGEIEHSLALIADRIHVSTYILYRKGPVHDEKNKRRHYTSMDEQ